MELCGHNETDLEAIVGLVSTFMLQHVGAATEALAADRALERLDAAVGDDV